MQWDWGEGPRIGDRRTQLWCAWLAWSRFRVVIPVWDKTLPTIVSCLDTTLRRVGGVPTYALTDNGKTVSVDHVAGIAVRNPDIVQVARHYGMTIRTCVPADPQSRGGSEATVRIAKADLVPTTTNLLAEYRTFGELETACRAFCVEVNDRAHRETRRRPTANLRTRRKRAAFPAGKTFGDWEEQASSIPRPTQNALKTLEWVARKENLCICGPSGTGKSHYCEALGHAAVEAGMTVAWFTIEDLGVLVRRHRVDDSIARAMTRLIRTDLIIVDDIGLLPVSPDAAEGFYRLVDAAYERPGPGRLQQSAPVCLCSAHRHVPWSCVPPMRS